jgi:hypothetical protein
VMVVGSFVRTTVPIATSSQPKPAILRTHHRHDV